MAADGRAAIHPRSLRGARSVDEAFGPGRADAGAGAVLESVGTGPFALRSFSPRDRAVLVRNSEYWGRDARAHALPYLDEVQVVFSPDVAAEVVALQGGELQLVMALTSELATDGGPGCRG